jgi:hypothetical protein
MHIVAFAWLYVTALMAVVQASSSNSSLLDAIITFLAYGVLPVLLVLYLMGAPSRWRAIKARERKALTECPSITPNAHGKAAADPVAPVRVEP